MFAAGALPLSIVAGSTPAVSASTAEPFCARLGHSIQASSGAHLFCDAQTGARPMGQPRKTATVGSPATAAPLTPAVSFASGGNVDAANPAEDVTPASAQLYGQSETSIAANDSFVVEAWNDSTGFATTCPAPQSKEELTGYGFSSDAGASFTDEGGLPNPACSTTGYVLFGDPSVETWKHQGKTYFYVSSLYDNFSNPSAPSQLAINACQATSTGITCGSPVVAAQGGCQTISTPKGSLTVCDFLDKEFLAIDPVRHRLYIAYTNFKAPVPPASGNGEIDLASCDISDPLAPACSPTSPIVIAAEDPTCINEGAYPAVDPASGDVYVAWEFNWATNIFAPPCFNVPTQDRLVRVPFGAPTPSKKVATSVVSMTAAFVPGFNRFPMSDFPRIAVSDPSGTVSIAWNDARRVPTGDILLQSFALKSLTAIQSSPLRLNTDATPTWKFLPALRNADASGQLNVSWYDRRGQTGAMTNVWAALNVDPRATSTPTNAQITDVASDWNAVSSDVIPNFGDYTDNYVAGSTLYVAWSDGRLGLPQPFASP